MLRWTVIATFLLLLTIAYTDVVSNSTETGGVKLVDWTFKKFENYFSLLLILIAMCLFKMFYHNIPFIPKYLPESMLLIVIGVIVGAVFKVTSDRPMGETVWKLTPEVFFEYLLPPIVLDAAYCLYNRTFLDYLGSILVYAVVGTVLNFLIIGPMMFGLSQAGVFGSEVLDINLNYCFLFASLIVAVDPVAVLAIFQDIGVNPGLYCMVFGESLLNDAVTVVLYKVMNEFVNVSTVTVAEIGLGIGSFFTISLGGLLVGVVYGVVSSFFTRWKSHFAPVFMLLMAYFSYIMGDCLGWSGIIAIIGCGLVQADYAFHNISPPQRTTLRAIIKQIAEVSEGFIFFLIGIYLFSSEIEWHTGFCLWGLASCLVARIIIVLFLSFLINRVHLNDMQIPMRQQIILIYGGLRGAVALCLAILVDFEDLGGDGKSVRKMIVTATLFIILITVGLMGTTMKPLVRLFHVKLAGKRSLSMWADMNRNLLDHGLAGIEAIVGATGRNRLRQVFTRLDDKIIRPWLQRDPETHDERIVKTYEKISLKLHFATIHPAQSSTYLARLPETLKNQLLVSQSQFHLDVLAQKPSNLSLDNLLNEQKEDIRQDVTVLEPHTLKSLDPQWRRRTSLIDQGRRQEEFNDTFIGLMKMKLRLHNKDNWSLKHVSLPEDVDILRND